MALQMTVGGKDESVLVDPPIERKPWWRRPRTWVLVVLLWCVVAFAAIAVAAVDLLAGRDAASEARDLSLEEVVDGGSIAPLRTAHQRFDRASFLLDLPPVVPFRFFPVAGRQLRSVTALAAAGSEISAVGIEGVESAREVLSRAPNSGPERIDRVRRLGGLASRLGERLSSVGLGPSESLASPLEEARGQLADDLDRLQTGLRRGGAGATTLADLLQGPSSYLVLAANNAEMRAGSGMFLQVGRLVTADGRFSLTEMTSVHDVVVPPGAVALGGDMKERWGWLNPNIEWANLMLSPRFPVSADLAARMWAAAGRPEVDGVLALDPVALSAIITATGPVTVGDRQIGGDEVVQEILHDQYVRRPELAQADERREELAGIATAAVRALDEQDWKPATLARGLAEAVAGRHVLAWAKDDSANEGWQLAGVSGALTTDSMMVALLNRGGNKLDPFMAVDAELTLSSQESHTDGTLRIRLKNNTPAGEVPYIAGPHFGLPLAPGEYLGLLTVTLPGATESADFEGIDQFAVAGPDGPTRVIGYEFRLLPGQEHAAVLRFRLPRPHGSLTVEPSARVPQVEWRWGSDSWKDAGAHEIIW
ncbi:MAG: DUF4012 domain-containing protein [Actinobacteria bacterium]|nr:DUF4012 domain-containing protein [Actinomycetota bacterium]